MGAGNYGGFGKTSGSIDMMTSSSGTSTVGSSSSDGNNVSLPKGKAQLKHIFSKRKGHLTDTPYHRTQLKKLANDSDYYKGEDKYGNKWNIKIMRDGSQLWVRYRNGVINEGGRNENPRLWDKDTGLNNNPKKRGGKKQ